MGNACSSAEIVSERNDPKQANNTVLIRAFQCTDSGLNDVLGHRDTTHISRAAVSLSWLKHFIKTHRLDETRLTTAQLVQQLVKPPTAARQCRFTQLLLDNDPSLQGSPQHQHHYHQQVVSQGRPFYFVSHAWSRPFAETLAMVARHFEPEQQRLWRRRGPQLRDEGQQDVYGQEEGQEVAGAVAAVMEGRKDEGQCKEGQLRHHHHQQQQQPVLPAAPLAETDVYLWFDMFAISQHNPGGADSGDLSVLHEVIQDAEGTLMVLDGEGTALTRIWCLYEAWQTYKAGPGKIQLLSYGLDYDELKKVFIDLDVSRAQASVEEDRIRILGSIRDSLAGGLHQMTHELKDALVAGAVSQVYDIEDAWTSNLGHNIYTAATLCHLYGRLEQAEQLFRRNVTGSQAVLAPDDPWVMLAIDNLAGVLKAQGKYGQAEQLHRQALENFERGLGPHHPGTLAAANNLALVLHNQGQYDEAEILHRRVLESYERRLNVGFPSTCAATAATATAAATAANSVATVDATVNDSQEILRTLNNLALLLQDQGKYGEAEQLHRRVLAGLERLLGSEHPDTLSSVTNLASILKAVGQYDEAEQLHRRALLGRERVLGSNHPDTLRSANNVANALKEQSKFKDAEALHVRVVSSLEKVLGPDHPDTLSAVSNLAVTIQNDGRHREAEGLHREVLASREQVLGPDHPDTLDSVENLAGVLWLQGRLGEAEGLLRRGLESRQRVLGSEHPDTVTCASHLSALLLEQAQAGQQNGQTHSLLGV
ncbi:hypothetical protein Vretimale_6273 [Volvox reticuliferus]|uniref:Kinesin light chain n=2 Tax=Volvox reticuliferus TaxID=1737510 RepID=A0A8J4G7F6_9CHLO|nr:hypothetical protein Vretifemale_15979 [Volvox reticuliferus]GIM01524.1 hypothetical protein Vretimale_6273 [Volvox reticuliferus]